MKVLHIINSLIMGGAEVLLQESLPFAAGKGVRAEVLVLEEANTGIEEMLISRGVPVHHTWPKSRRSPAQICAIRTFLNRNQYDLIHVHLFPAVHWVAAATFGMRGKIPLVYTEHSTSNKLRKSLILGVLDRVVYKFYDHVFCISEGVQRALNQWSPITRKKSSVVLNGIDYERFNCSIPLEKSDIFPSANNKTRLILMVASFNESKDHDTLLRAMRILPDEFVLVLVGEGHLKEKLTLLVSSLGLIDRVVFLGYRNDVDRIMKTADVYVQSSNWEGFGLAAVEAMAAGLPVVASRVDGLSEVVDGYGVMFERGDIKSLASIISEVLTNTVYREDIKKNALKWSKKFDISSMLDSHISTYKRLVDRRI